MVTSFREFGCVAKVCLVLLACSATLFMPGCGSNPSSLPGEPTLNVIVVAPLNQSIPVGGTQQFTATGDYSDGTTKDITTSVTWSSSDQTVATVSNAAGTNGLAAGVGKGSAIIKAALGIPVGQTASFNVTEPITLITISPNPASVASGIPQQFTATATYADNSTGDVTSSVTWNSSDTTKATISNVPAFNGLATTLAVGSPSISASMGSVTSPPATLNISAAIPVGLIVSPQNPAIADAGATRQFTALAQYSDGTTQDVTSAATWSSNNSGVAGVSSGGLVTSGTLTSGQTAGFTSISASWTAPTPAAVVAKSKKATSTRSVKGQGVSGTFTANGVSILSVTKSGGNGFAGVFTQHNDMFRTGENINETTLTTAPTTGVSATTFGKKFSQSVDGFVFAQPLYVPNVAINGVTPTHNVVYVATEGDSVYAFDADSNTSPNNTFLWRANLIDQQHGATSASATTVSAAGSAPDVRCGNIANQIGITATPVIDPSTNTMYVETESKENGSFFQRLHAIDITTGAEKPSWPITITGTYPGTADGSTTVTFDPLMQMSRPGLLLLNGTVYVTFSSNCDNIPYHGWVFSYKTATLAQTGIYVTTPNGGLGGIWMSGCGIAGDSAGDVYLVVGNGDFDTTNVPAVETGDSILKFGLRGKPGVGSGALSLVDYFTPSDQDNLDSRDLDLGSGGLSLLPDTVGSSAHPHLLVQAGKNGDVFLVDRDQMTANNQHYCANCTTNNNVVQDLPTAVGGMWSMPAYWNNNVYFWGNGDNLAAYSLSNGLLSTQPTGTSILSLVYPGAVPTVSANGATNGIIWAIDATSQSTPAVLHAFDAIKGLPGTFTEIYNTTMAASNRDAPGFGVKFSIPTVAKGKLYMGTQTELDVYGPLP